MKVFGTKSMIRAAIVLLCGTALVLPAMAQDTPPPPPPPGQQGPPPGGQGRGGMDPARRLDMLQHRLNLTPDQTAQVKTILEAGRTKMQALRNDQSGGDMRAKMMAAREDENTQIKATLNPDQKKIFDDMQKEECDRMRERNRDGGPQPPAGTTTPQQ